MESVPDRNQKLVLILPFLMSYHVIGVVSERKFRDFTGMITSYINVAIEIRRLSKFYVYFAVRKGCPDLVMKKLRAVCSLKIFILASKSIQLSISSSSSNTSLLFANVIYSLWLVWIHVYLIHLLVIWFQPDEYQCISINKFPVTMSLFVV